jgi:hypothetical protein
MWWLGFRCFTYVPGSSGPSACRLLVTRHTTLGGWQRSSKFQFSMMKFNHGYENSPSSIRVVVSKPYSVLPYFESLYFGLVGTWLLTYLSFRPGQIGEKTCLRGELDRDNKLRSVPAALSVTIALPSSFPLCFVFIILFNVETREQLADWKQHWWPSLYFLMASRRHRL